MDVILGIIGTVSILIGVIFSVLGVIGILRLPDTYSRLHASGKTSTLGVLFICFGTAFIMPSAILKLLALGIFIIFSGPVGSHAIAAAVHRGAAIHNQAALTKNDESLVEASGIHQENNIQSILDQIHKQTKEN
jgi:multicomponent Na+:H+ antiporter subunit G